MAWFTSPIKYIITPRIYSNPRDTVLCRRNTQYSCVCSKVENLQISYICKSLLYHSQNPIDYVWMCTCQIQVYSANWYILKFQTIFLLFLYLSNKGILLMAVLYISIYHIHCIRIIWDSLLFFIYLFMKVYIILMLCEHGAYIFLFFKIKGEGI